MPYPSTTTYPSSTTFPGIPSAPVSDPLLVEFTSSGAPVEIDDTAVPLDAVGGLLIGTVEV